ncbi:MAG: 6-carboxytetrahydropterin synthase [Phycisphaerales bacterium]|nr:6-carboxytetrahydropterin synthase [Phycisphaerales bacterium]
MILLTREVRFSVDRDWAGRIEPSRPITNSWAGWPSAVGIVPYLCLRATVAGEPDATTGYLCNIKLIDDLLRTRAIPATAEALEANGWRISAERLLRGIWGAVRDQAPVGATLRRLELLTTPFLSYAIESEAPQMTLLTQQFEFSAAHRLHCPSMSDEENVATFGKCNNPNGHGHNYLLEVSVRGELDARGAILPLPHFERIVQQRVIDVLDHKHLNEDTTLFRELNPSVENITRVIWSLLAAHVGPAELHAIRVWETPKTWAEYRGD